VAWHRGASSPLARARGTQQSQGGQVKKILVVGVAVLAVPAAVAFGGSGTDRATGGGQILIGKSAGNTISFEARGTSDAATGNVQYVNRDTGTGQSQVTRHGRVSCLAVDGNMAKLAGTWDQGGTFQVLVVDNGQGVAADNDLVTVQNTQDPTCDPEDDDDDGPTELGRGNAQVYDAG
jgi:hypothetical protein